MTAGEPALPEEAFAAALASVSRIGPVALRRLLEADPPSVAWARAGHEGDVARIWRRHEESGISVCWRGGPDYPPRLADDPDAPAVLFCVGDPTAVNRYPTVALVGTRSPTRYGIGVAAQLGADLAAAGVSVVSGLALGIDGAAHEGATAAGAPPVAVVAGGLDEPYPPRHARLWSRVAEQGAVYSESPAGVPTERWRFPVRNRLLAMLSDVVVVVESRHHGGSMYTVEAAAARGTPVGVVPGSIRSPASEGTNSLLADGCFPVCAATDILVALSLRGIVLARASSTDARGDVAGTEPGAGTTGSDDPQGGAGAALGATDRALWAVLSADPISLDQLARLTGWEISALCGGLERLARAGMARDIGGWWERA